MPKYTRQEQGSLHRGQWVGFLKERYSNTKATVEHSTVRKGWGKEEIKKRSQVGSALGSLAPQEFGAVLGQLGESQSLSSSWGSGQWGWIGGVRVGAREKWAQTEAPEVGSYTYHSFLEMKDPSF